MVAIDATVLILFLRPDSGAPAGHDGKPIPHAADRVAHLVTTLSEAGVSVVIPTPALAEALVRSDAAAASRIVDEFQRHRVFRIEPFDTLAAIELAAMTRDSLRRGRKKGDSAATWAKLKFDQQIVAIAKVHRVDVIYSDDPDVRGIARRAGIDVIGIADLELPPAAAQFKLELDPHK